MLYFPRGFQILTDNELDLIHQQSLRILEKIGFKLPHPYFLELFAQAGAEVNITEQVVKVPPSLVKEALIYAKEKLTTFSRQDNKSLHVCMPSETFYADYKTKSKRKGTTEDILKGIVLGNSLPNVATIMPIVTPADVPPDIADIISHHLCFLYAKKPFHAWTMSPVTAEYILEMAMAAAKPVAYIGEIISPLQISKETLEIVLCYTKYDLPVGFGSIVTAGTTGPVTLAGTLALQNAEYLMGLTICCFLNIPRPVTFAAGAHTMDLRSAACSFGSPNQALLAVAQTQLSKKYGLPATWNVGLSDANYPDFQGGFEKGMSAALALASGIDEIGLQGIVGADQGANLEQLVIDNEWVDALNHVMRGFEVTEETLAWETISGVGIGGNFIASDHTFAHMRSVYWDAQVFNRDNWDNWLLKGGREVFALAAARVESILEEHYPPAPVVAEKVVLELEKIAQKAKEKLCK